MQEQWLAGVFDACGRLAIHGEYNPALSIEFNTPNPSLARELIERLDLNQSWYSHKYGWNGHTYVLDIHQEEKIRTVLSAVKGFSMAPNLADVGFYILDRQKEYKTNSKALPIVFKLKEKLSWKEYNSINLVK